LSPEETAIQIAFTLLMLAMVLLSVPAYLAMLCYILAQTIWEIPWPDRWLPLKGRWLRYFLCTALITGIVGGLIWTFVAPFLLR
jgi:hypothetical protein